MGQLSERLVRTAKAGPAPRTIADGDNGLHLVLNPGGARTYIFRRRVGKRWVKVKIGRSTEITLDDARDKALEYKQAVKRGRDPSLDAKIAKTVSQSATQTWKLFDKQHVAKKKPRTAKEYRRIWNKDIEPHIGSAALQSLTGADLRRVVTLATERSEGAGRLSYSLLSAFLGWCVEEGHLEANPLPRKSFSVKVREHHLREHEIVWLLRACRELRDHRGERGSLAVARWAIAVEVLLRTGQRDSNITAMTDTSIIDGTLVVRSVHFKGNRVHELPLPQQVLKLLKLVDRPDKSKRIFQRLGNKERALDVIRAKMVEIAGCEVDHWSLHSLRKTFDTTMRDMWDDELDRPLADHQGIEAVLGHSLQGVSRHYNFSRMLREKQRLLTAWNLYLDGLLAA